MAPSRPNADAPIEVVGPVASLESYVKAEWWRDIFNANYLRTDGDVVDDAGITRSEVDAFAELLVAAPDDPILDLCCGQGRHVLELARRGYRRLSGFDRSRYLLSRARRQARSEGLAVKFREGDARELPYRADTFARVYMAGNSFGYFEAASDDERVVAELARVLRPGGRVLLDIADGDYLREHFEARSWEWIDRDSFVCRERQLSADGQRLISREVIVQANRGVVADQFYAERLYDLDGIQALLARFGFHDVALGGPVVPASQRGQDLGMMARRLLVTATVDKPWAAVPKPPAVRNVLVVRGDPRLQDAVKPGAVFDADDMDTVTRLDAALAELPGYRFRTADDHGDLLRLLTAERGEIDLVFNLCDEGLYNQATYELHVPALLEALRIPYTGGTPQCLAYCYDKSLVRGIATELDIPVPAAFTIGEGNTNFFELPVAFPVIAKPNCGDSSIGINRDSVCRDVGELEAAISRLRAQFGPNTVIVVEAFLTGKDLTVGLIGNPEHELTVLPIVEEDYSALPPELPRVCGYEAKWDPESPYAALRSVVADLPREVELFLESSCATLFRRLGCRDYARFDWRLDANGTPRLLEANPNPGWCWDGHLAKMCALAGISYGQMLGRILDAAARRTGVAAGGC